jgi:NADPH:quinone reductase-like Zn-dependent oxidoreductase
MRAIVFETYGAPDVLRLKEMAKPTPKPNEVLVRIHASPINYGDISARNFKNIGFLEFNMPAFLLLFAKMAFGYSRPKIKVLGNQFSGEIEGMGEKAKRFKTGDLVFGYSGMKMGAYADYLCMDENGVIGIKPRNMSHEEASAVPYGIMAVQLLSKLNIQSGNKVLVNGGSGGIGSIAVQLLKSLGAKVTATCSADRIGYVKDLGADFVEDYTEQAYLNKKEKYDFVLDVLGRLTWSDAKKILTDNGTCLFASFKTGKLFQMLLSGLFGKKKLICAFAGEKRSDLEKLRELAEAGKLKTIVDRVFPLQEAAKAHEYYEKKRNKGQVILSITR